MIDHRPFAAIGAANHGWLDARHHFSFADYRDPARMQWGRLRVWNDDRIAPNTGFSPHPHRDMEIITYVRTGAISHADSLGNSGRTVAGDVQVMSAGTGIEHSEFNREDSETTLFQIWILPDSAGAAPRWDTRPFPKADRAGRWVVLASGVAGDDLALPINADARVAGATIRAGESLAYAPRNVGRHVYLVPASGSLRIGDIVVQARDGVAIADEAGFTLTAIDDCEVVLVETA